MNKLLPLLFCWLTLTANAQVITDAHVIKVYNAAVKKMKPEYQKGIKQLPGQQMSFAIYTIYHQDTLNKKQAWDYSNIHISAVADKTGKNTPVTEAKKDDIDMPVPCAALLNGDTLTIAISPAFNPYLKHQIVGRQIVSTYEENQDGDPIYRLKLSDSKKQHLSVPVKTTSFKLSTSHYQSGQVIYGEVSFATEPYYADDSSFKSGYLYTRLRGAYVFKAVIIDVHNPPRP